MDFELEIGKFSRYERGVLRFLSPTDSPPQAEIFYISSDEILLKFTLSMDFSNDFDPEFQKFPPAAGLHRFR